MSHEVQPKTMHGGIVHPDRSLCGGELEQMNGGRPVLRVRQNTVRIDSSFCSVPPSRDENLDSAFSESILKPHVFTAERYTAEIGTRESASNRPLPTGFGPDQLGRD